ncbi:InlB B-repeat-containing protein [Ruminococcus intestinalis]|uniref:InlB B-repeat-containing protein n=1 Tax=Ruminococcus intestinalis TaxID=2763066 RepID=UPI003F7DF513
MKKLKNLNKNSGGKVSMKLKSALLLLLVAIFSISGIMTVNAATVKDDGKYTLLLTCGLNGMDGKVDGDYAKIIKFDVADGDTTVSLSELTAGVLPFNGSTKFAYWATDWTGETKVAEDIPLSDFNSEGTFWANDGEVAYTNGLTIYATFSEEVLKGTGTYYLTLDGVGGKVNGKYEMTLTSSSSAYQTVDLTKYTPVRDGYTFVGWALNGEFVTEISADCFKESDAVKVLATYTKNTFDNDGIVVTLNANGGQLNGKESNTYDYVGGRDSGALMSLLPYVPVREGYTFNGWNTKSDGSGTMETYIYWRIWDNNEETNKKYDKDTLITEDNGYVRYKNVTLYASWTKASGEQEKPGKDTVKEIQSTGETKAKIEFATEVSKDYKLDIKSIEVKKELADKNVKFIADINVLDGNNNVVKISDTKMKIRIALPEDLKGYDKYEVVYIVNDEIKETLTAAVENGYIVFETNHLSQYGIIATNTGNGTTSPNTGDTTSPKTGETTSPNTGNGTTSPKTGDTTSPKTGDTNNIVLWAALLFISCGALAGTLVIDKKKKTIK